MEPDLPFNYVYCTEPLCRDVSGELYRFLEDNGIGRISLLGWSMGAFIASDFATRYPDKIGALIMVSATREFDITHLHQQVSELQQDRNATMMKFYRLCFHSRPDLFQWFKTRYLTESMALWNLEALLSGLSYLENKILDLSDLKDLSIIVVHGARDMITHVSRLPRLPEGTSRVIFPQSGHLPFLEPQFRELLTRIMHFQ